MNRRFAVGAAMLVVAMLASATPARADGVPLKAEDSNAFTGESYRQYGIWVGDGTSTLLGDYTTEYLVHGTGNGDFIAIGTLTAANGDTLFTISIGELVAAGYWEGTFVVEGGTGRFAGATGGGEFSTTLVEPGVVDNVIVGTVYLP